MTNPTPVIEAATLRVQPHFEQAHDDDGNRHDVQRGYVVQGLITCPRGDALYEKQGVCQTEAIAWACVARMCGGVSNGYTAQINTAAGSDWAFVGASY